MIRRIFFCLIIFCLNYSANAAIVLDRVVAVVNKEVITWSELYKMMDYESTDQLKHLQREERMQVFKDNEKMFLDKLIDMKLQIQEAKRLGFEVSPEEIQEAIENIKNKYSMNDSELEESLKKEGLTLEEYKKRLHDQMLLSQFINRQIRNKIVVSDEEIQKYMEKKFKEFNEGEAYRIKQIFLKRPEGEYDKKAIDEKVSTIIKRLNEGEDFSKLAEEYSEDSSAKDGGDLGIIEKKHMAEEFINVISKMEVGEVSGPFWTEKGLHIIKLEEVLSESGTDEVKEAIKKELIEAKFQDRFTDYLKNLREKAHIEIRL